MRAIEVQIVSYNLYSTLAVSLLGICPLGVLSEHSQLKRFGNRFLFFFRIVLLFVDCILAEPYECYNRVYIQE